ncbi:MAG: glucosylglycerol hydrolase [Myxococcota bacterium]|nr:glucosylglycerol hydrolase [Myxococcota bacterium]
MNMPADRPINRLATHTQTLVEWCDRQLAASAGPSEAYRQVARKLGAFPRQNRTEVWIEFGFWLPELTNDNDVHSVRLEIFLPPVGIQRTELDGILPFRRVVVPLTPSDGDCWWAAVGGLPIGHRQNLGALYWVTATTDTHARHVIRDHLATALPLGVFGPAEVYDSDAIHRGRRDLAWYANEAPQTNQSVSRVKPPVNLMEVHVPTASPEGTIAGLTRVLRAVAQAIRSGEDLTPAETVWLDYDGLELMPLHPTVTPESALPVFEIQTDIGHESDAVVSCLIRPPQTTNWGYDVVISGCAAINPQLLETGCPTELVELAELLHQFPGGGMKLVIDVVFGHADNQALDLLNEHFLTGPNMYGQDLAYQHPAVRAILLEMYRRLVNFGFDGVRVDGAQDFKYWDAKTESVRHDDEFLDEMSLMVHTVADHAYRPWMVFEDGRPWPQADWQLSSSYRSVIVNQAHDPDVFQWGPLTFAHNTPALFTFWASKWWRLLEVVHHGQNWITGCANHDTVRRGTQLGIGLNINHRLGENLPAILKQAYDNPASTLLTHCVLPGVPMDFLQSSTRSPWGFMRNTDRRYGVKVAAEETGFFHWQVDDGLYGQTDHFVRLKALGFQTLDSLRRFLTTLQACIEATEYDLPAVLNMMQARFGASSWMPVSSIQALNTCALAVMDDMHDVCTISHHLQALDARQTQFNRQARAFRRAHPWLRQAFRSGDLFQRRTPAAGTALFYGHRHGPSGHELVFVLNMEGAPVEVSSASLLSHLTTDHWQLACSTPGLRVDGFAGQTTLRDSQGFVLIR